MENFAAEERPFNGFYTRGQLQRPTAVAKWSQKRQSDGSQMEPNGSLRMEKSFRLGQTLICGSRAADVSSTWPQVSCDKLRRRANS